MPFESLGIIETNSIAGSLKVINSFSKLNDITFIEKQLLGEGIVSVLIKGELGAIRNALELGAESISNSNDFRSSHIIPMPHKDLLLKFNLEGNN